MGFTISISGDTREDIARHMRVMLSALERDLNETPAPDATPPEAPAPDAPKGTSKRAKVAAKKAGKKTSKKTTKKTSKATGPRGGTDDPADGEGTTQHGENVGPNSEDDDVSSIFDGLDDDDDDDDSDAGQNEDGFEPPEVVGSEDLTLVATACMKTGHKNELIAILHTFETEDGENCKALSKVQEDDWPALYKKCHKLIGFRDPAVVIAAAVAD